MTERKSETKKGNNPSEIGTFLDPKKEAHFQEMVLMLRKKAENIRGGNKSDIIVVDFELKLGVDSSKAKELEEMVLRLNEALINERIIINIKK